MGFRDKLYAAIDKAEADGWSVEWTDTVRATRDGWSVKLADDPAPWDPREWDNLGVMVCFHGRYKLGDEGHGFRTEDYESWADMMEAVAERFPGSPILPLGLIDHSGLSMYVGGGAHPCDPGGWDSGTVGFIVADPRMVPDDATPEDVEGWLRAEVAVYDAYLTGDVSAYVVTDPDGSVYDACGGWYGQDGAADALTEGVGIAEGGIASMRAELAATEAALDDVRDVAAGLALVAKRDALRITAGASA